MIYGWLLKSVFTLLLLSEILPTFANPISPRRSLRKRYGMKRKLRRNKLLGLDNHPTRNAKLRAAVVSNAVTDVNGTVIAPYDTIYTFDQLIDHNNPSLGTFKQRFWHTWEWYKPGGPIILYTAGEGNSEPTGAIDITNVTMQGALAQSMNGAVISIEHRFFGQSNPYPDLTAKSLAVHTIAQSIQDMANFALNVKLPMPGGNTDAIRPNNTPWVFVGGSYSGALTTYIVNKEPNIFFAGYSSSGVVQPIADFWQYFEPIRLNMPQNCSADVQAVMQYVDQVVASNNQTAITEMQDFFSLSNMDVPSFLQWMESIVQEWQALDVTGVGRSLFYDFCDALEVQNGRIAPASGWGLNVAMQAWADFFRNSGYLDGTSSVEAKADAGSEDTEVHDDATWLWIVCNEVGFVQKGPPLDYTGPAIAPRQLSLSDQDTECQEQFPGAFKANTVSDRVAASTQTYGGWNIPSNRLFVVTGSRDPWLYATFSSPAKPQNVTSTDDRPINLGDGFHCSDLNMEAGLYSEKIGQIQQKAMSTFSSWIKEFKASDSPATINPVTTASPTSSTSPTGKDDKKSSARMSKDLWNHGFTGIAISVGLSLAASILVI